MTKQSLPVNNKTGPLFGCSLFWQETTKKRFCIVGDEAAKSNCALMATDATRLIFTLLGHVVKNPKSNINISLAVTWVITFYQFIWKHRSHLKTNKVSRINRCSLRLSGINYQHGWSAGCDVRLWTLGDCPWRFVAIVKANTRRLMACMIAAFCLNDCAAPFCSEAAEFGRNESVLLFEIVLWAQYKKHTDKIKKKHSSRGDSLNIKTIA